MPADVPRQYDGAVTKDQLIGKFERLRGELLAANATNENPVLLERLVDELAATRRRIVEMSGSEDEQSNSRFDIDW